MTILIVFVTIAAWGVWLLPECYARRRVPVVTVFYATLANLIVATIVQWSRSEITPNLSAAVTAAIFLGGIVWAFSGVCAFVANQRLGLARAVGFRTPLNILTSLLWGAVLFGEFHDLSASRLALTWIACAGLIAGLLLIVRAGTGDSQPVGSSAIGWFAAATAGVLWGTYYLPIRWAGVSAWTAALPLAAGMWLGAAGAVLLRRETLRLPALRDYLLLLSCGVLWAAGNYGSLLLMERIGPGRGFALAQLCLAVNAVLSIYLLRQPPPGTAAAHRTLAGCAIATGSGALLGLTG